VTSLLQSKLSALENKRNNLDTSGENNRDRDVSSSLMKRARDAEDRVESLKRELAELRQSRGGESGGKAGASASASGGGGGSAADQTEIKKLQKRIKELEAGGGGGGNAANTAAAEKKAVAAAEKTFAKKIKDMETAARKEKGAVEQRAAAAEKQLEETTAALQTVTNERDALKIKVRELSNLSSEMEALRDKALRVDELTAEMASKNAEIATLTEQYKKEGALRKKYKNELEDLKGAIRVYARCRPMARYELDRNCQQVVRFVDETSMKIATSRGEKEFEFDAAFSPDSTQEQVFEDTRRLIESFLDGYNVCLFAYGQTGSGKTFTMTGSPTMPGLTPKSITEMFRLIGERKNCTTRITTYFVELYNDNLVVRIIGNRHQFYSI
jgi:DNA repair exonuclease SbcCD ATPase subunit